MDARTARVHALAPCARTVSHPRHAVIQPGPSHRAGPQPLLQAGVHERGRVGAHERGARLAERRRRLAGGRLAPARLRCQLREWLVEDSEVRDRPLPPKVEAAPEHSAVRHGPLRERGDGVVEPLARVGLHVAREQLLEQVVVRDEHDGVLGRVLHLCEQLAHARLVVLVRLRVGRPPLRLHLRRDQGRRLATGEGAITLAELAQLLDAARADVLAAAVANRCRQ
mmetsp:Transcript_55810/g.146514  ORF Transcript_55810/g.146514 Transcript_55810/m.146514 type:complete len:225 (+) Transcript_55810:66-740(+)